MHTARFTFALLALFPLIANADYQQLTEQETCYLKAMKGASGDVTVQTLMDACNQKPAITPEDAISQEIQQPKTIKVTPAAAIPATPQPTAIPPTSVAKKIAAEQPIPTPQIDNLSSPLSAKIVSALNNSVGISAGKFSGEILNPTKDWIITQVTFRIWPKGSNAANTAQEYPLSLQILPGKSAPFFLKLGKPVEEVDWQINQARGAPYTGQKSVGEELVDAILHKDDF